MGVALACVVPHTALAGSLSELRAEELARLAIGHPEADLEPFDPGVPEAKAYYSFEWIDPHPGTSVHVMFLAVNKKTGDVWNLDDCNDHLWPKLSKKRMQAMKPPAFVTPMGCEGASE
ncbi:MAG: hypothetical protein WDN72_08685 [Alphaproteobacteria bacterium]